jgi:subtilisin-like proprotein convertase family protein
VPVSFPGTGTGAIPDNNATGITVSFAVSGITSPLKSATLQLDLTHTWVGDLSGILLSPGGTARLVVFGRVGSTRTSNAGDSTNLGGTYLFSDLGGPDLWSAAAALPDAGVVSSGTFRSTTPGAPLLASAGGCPTSLNGVFGGLSPTDANGTWTLVVTDGFAGDLGTIGTSVLTLDTVGDAVFANGFESGVVASAPLGSIALPHCVNKVQSDFNGDGLTDYVLVRANGSSFEWHVRLNTGGGNAGVETVFALGNSPNDFVDTTDVDGDRIADPTVWTSGPAGTARFQVRLSSTRLSVLRTVVFGQTGDDPTQSGDYDGDGLDDLGVFRAPPFGDPAGPLAVLVRRSSDGGLTTISTGTGNDGDQFPISGFDYSGDGLADVVIQETDTVTPANGRFRVFNGQTGAPTGTFVFGLNSDLMIPGNHTGTAQADFTVNRTVAGNRIWETRDSATALVQPAVTFGVTNDSRMGGDYDGDGLSDYANWRGSSTPGASQFLIRPSTNTALTWTLVAGQLNDFPIAASRVH